MSVAPELVEGVDLLCLDAGNTVIFLDHARLADLLFEATGARIAPEVLVRAEGEAKRSAEVGELHDCAWAARDLPGAASWGKMVGTIALRAGVDASVLPRVLELVWRAHARTNLWCKVPERLGEALDELRALGAKVAVVSNSEGMLERLFAELGILGHFDLVVDSGKLGVEKPDARIFRVAFDAFGVAPERALHLGDVFATDVLGARAAGCRHALIDPYGHYEGRHLEVPRVPGAAPVARALAETRRTQS